MKTVVCKKCDWTSIALTKAEAQSHVNKFNKYYDTLTPKKRKLYYGSKKASLKDYTCLRCGGSEFTPGYTARTGSTLNPVIYEDNATGTSTCPSEIENKID